MRKVLVNLHTLLPLPTRLDFPQHAEDLVPLQPLVLKLGWAVTAIIAVITIVEIIIRGPFVVQHPRHPVQVLTVPKVVQVLGPFSLQVIIVKLLLKQRY